MKQLGSIVPLLVALHASTGCHSKVAPSPDLGTAPADAAMPPVAARDLAVELPPPVRDLSLTLPVADLAQGYTPIDGGPGIDVVELVSPAVCQTRFDHRLGDCKIGVVQLHAPPPMDAAPWMTELRTMRSGDCSTRYPLELKLQADSDPPIYFNPFNSSRMITVRHPNRSAIDTLTISNSSAWESTAIYSESCRLWVEVALNLHDPV